MSDDADRDGKITMESTVTLESMSDLSDLYTPGAAEAVRQIRDDPATVYDHTAKGNMAAVVSDGSSVLGLGNVGAAASIPILEGKCLLARELGDVSTVPLPIDEQAEDALIDTVARLEPMYGFLMLEDIASPKCFHVEDALKDQLDIPVFHDDQHGAAVATLAALQNALTVTDRSLATADIVIIGAGAAGTATADLLMEAGAERVTVVDRPGIIHGGMDDLTPEQQALGERTNPEQDDGSLADALDDADVLIGLSTGGIVSQDMIRSMADDPIVFALANPDPEVEPDEAKEAGAAVVGTGRADHPNQVNNSAVFPGVMRGCLDCRATDINTEMLLAAADAIADSVDDLRPDNVMPSTLDQDMVDAVAEAVLETAQETGVAQHGDA